MKVVVEYEVVYKVKEAIELDEQQLKVQFPNSDFLKDYWVDSIDYNSLKDKAVEDEKSNLVYDKNREFVKIDNLDLFFNNRLVDVAY